MKDDFGKVFAYLIKGIIPIGMFLAVRELAKLFYHNFVMMAAKGGWNIFGFDFGTLTTDTDVLLFLQSTSLYFTMFCNILCIALFAVMFRREVPAKYSADRVPNDVEFIMGQVPVDPFYTFKSVIAIMCVAIVVNNIINISGLGAMSRNYSTYVAATSGIDMAVIMVAHCIIAPIAEELCFRGLVFRRFMPVVGRWPAILLSSICFGVIHGNLVQFVFGFAVGIFLAHFYYYGRNIIIPIVAHMAVNLLATLMTYYGVMHWMYTNYTVFWGANLLYISIAAMIFKSTGKVKK
ncbi:MAG: CPBP family intramembrane metalloprotease [Lachnospiraceae bacterium]|nr:CPBP family intramembrane metalloprotease [Lachnospiraceae bacterium]